MFLSFSQWGTGLTLLEFSGWILQRSFESTGTVTTDAAPFEDSPPPSASGVNKCHPCLAGQRLSERGGRWEERLEQTWQLTELARFLRRLFYLELILKFLFNPLSHMTKSHLPLPQLGADMQIQLWGHRKAVPKERERTSSACHIIVGSDPCFLSFKLHSKWIYWIRFNVNAKSE